MTTTATLERPAPPPRSTGGMATLRERLRKVGLFDPQPEFYLASTLVALGFVAATIAVLVGLQGSWWALLAAPVAAIAGAQLAFLGHDIGHHQVFRNRRWEWPLGAVVANLLTGLSWGWWNNKHNRHHANPNVDGEDPDIADNVIAWSDKQAAQRTGFGRWFARHQAKFFLPILTLTGWSLRAQSVQTLSQRKGAKRIVEAVLLLAHIVGVVSFLWWTGGLWFAIVFILVMNLIWGLLMGMSFAPNHKGMAFPEKDERWDHLHKQVLTSRNITGSTTVDWWYGGLNYQIEHHLFPNLPRPNLKHAQPIVEAYCAEVGLPYHRVSVRDSYREIWAHLDSVAPARDDVATAGR